MHLFLTSSPCDDDVPAGCDLPCILFEKNLFVENLLACVDASRPCVIVAATPDACALNDEMVWTFHRAFAWHGMAFPYTTVVDDRNAQELPQLIRESGTVILGGGHVPTQNAFFRRIGLKALLQEYPGVIMGISAGTMNCCGTVYAQPEEPGEATDPAYQRFILGLGLTDVMVLPHYQRVKDNTVDGLHLFRDLSVPDSKGRCFYALPDASYVLQTGNAVTLYGEAWQLKDGSMRLFSRDGDIVTLSDSSY